MTNSGPVDHGPDFVVLTGFLGSGKTTLLRELLATPAAGGTAIIVNEVGAIGLDGALLREAGGEVAAGSMTMLANGCVCCQLGSDLAATVEALLAAERPDGLPPLDRIVLETSGLSKPGPVLRQLATLAPHRMRVLVLATFDASRGPATANAGEAAAQWAGAHRIVVTKADMVSARAFAQARGMAATINPLAEIVAEPERPEALRRAFAAPTAQGAMVSTMPSAESGDTASAVDPEHPRLATFLLRQPSRCDYDDVAAWLDNLAGALGDRLLRLKGLVEVTESDAPLLVQSVGTLFSAPRPFRGEAPEGGPFLVVIGRDIGRAEIEAVPPSLGFRIEGWAETSPFRRPPARKRPLRAEPA